VVGLEHLVLLGLGNAHHHILAFRHPNAEKLCFRKVAPFRLHRADHNAMSTWLHGTVRNTRRPITGIRSLKRASTRLIAVARDNAARSPLQNRAIVASCLLVGTLRSLAAPTTHLCGSPRWPPCPAKARVSGRSGQTSRRAAPAPLPTRSANTLPPVTQQGCRWAAEGSLSPVWAARSSSRLSRPAGSCRRSVRTYAALAHAAAHVRGPAADAGMLTTMTTCRRRQVCAVLRRGAAQEGGG